MFKIVFTEQSFKKPDKSYLCIDGEYQNHQSPFIVQRALHLLKRVVNS
jgi:hypothetical protein